MKLIKIKNKKYNKYNYAKLHQLKAKGSSTNIIKIVYGNKQQNDGYRVIII